MTFQNPGALLWLIPLWGLILALYLLRMRRRDVRVPATFLWPERVEEVRANALFQKLRFNWLMVLQLVAAGLLVMALAKPQTSQSGLTGDVTVFVLDASASMQATDVLPTRFDAAKQQVREAIMQARAGDRLALIQAGAIPKVLFPLGSDPSRQLRALDQASGSDADAGLAESLRLAAALVSGLDGARIVVLSDGGSDKIADFSPGKASLLYRKVGTVAENLAISALGVSDTGRGPQAFVAVQNFGAKSASPALTFRADGKVIDSVRLQVDGGKTWSRTVPVPPEARLIEASLDADDALAADNVAYAIQDPGASLRILLVTRGNLFLERGLALDPRVTLDKASEVPTGERGSGSGAYDIVVFDGVPEVPVRARGVLTLGAAGPGSPVDAVGRAENPRFVDRTATPLLEGVGLDGVFIERMQKVGRKPGAVVVAETNQGPLVVVRNRPEKKQIYVAFSPMDSDFPLRVGFPIFLANALDFLGGESKGNVLAVRPGQPFSVPVPEGQSPKLIGDRGTIDLPVKDGIATVRQIDRVGRYRLTFGSMEKTIVAQLRSERESRIRPTDRLDLQSGEVQAVQAPARFSDFWRPLLLMCLIVLAGEWWLYARRS